MSEKSEQTKKKIAQNADKITIAVLAIILLGMGFMWYKEQNSGVGNVDASGKAATFDDKLTDSPALKMVKSISEPPPIASDPAAVNLAQYSMFDATAVAGEQALEQAADAKIAQAKTLIEQKNTDEARKLLNEVMDVARYRKDAAKMLDDVTTKSETAANPAAGPV